MQQNKTFRKRVAVCGFAVAMLSTAILGAELLQTPTSVKAEETATTNTSHYYTLTEQIAKVVCTDDDKTTAGWDGTTVGTAEMEAAYGLAFAKSDLKFYAGASNGDSGWHTTQEYYLWAQDGSNWKWSYTAINDMMIANVAGNMSTDYGLRASGTHTIGGSGYYHHIWVVGWTAPADGVLTIPEHTLTVDSFAGNATALNLGWTMGDYIMPLDTGLSWTTYTATGDYTIAEQTYAVSAGDTVYLNMFTERTEGSAKTTINYNPAFVFTEKEVQKNTLGEEIGKVTYTDEEVTASGLSLLKGVLGDPNTGTAYATNNLTEEQLAKKATFYQTAFGRSDLKFYAGHTDTYTKTEYWERAVDINNSYKYSWTHINGLSAGHSGTTDSRINASGSHIIVTEKVWGFGWTAPSDGVLTIPAHTLKLKNTEATDFQLGISKDDGSRTTMNPSDTTLNWVVYGETQTTHTIPGVSYEVNEGDMVYITMYVSTTNQYIDYNPTFVFASSVVGEVKANSLTAEEDLGLNFYVNVANAESATATMQMDGETAIEVNGEYVEAQSAWRFAYPVAAKDYDKNVSFALTSVNGIAIDNGVTDSYSVKEYTDAIAAGDYSESAKTLAASIATYCESAKVYFDETAAAAAEKVTDGVIAKADLTASKAVLTGESDGNVTAVLGATLALESKTMIHVYFTATDVSAITGAEAVEGVDNLYVLKVAVVAKDLGTAQTIEVGGYTVTYSAYSYIEATVDSADAALYNVLQALYDYGVSAAAYLG